jgi:undecaprenyl-diphosphatase
MYLLVNLVVLVVASVAARGQQLQGVELAIFRLLNELPNSLALVFLVLTQAGSAWMLFGLTLLLVGFGQNRLALRLFGTGTLAFLLAELLKNIVARPRPPVLVDAVVRGHLLGDYGFPSGHTAVATAAGLVLLGVVPTRYRWLCWLWIGLVAASRIYLGVHAPLDVVGGFTIGVSVVCVSLLVPGKLAFVRKITHLKLSR